MGRERRAIQLTKEDTEEASQGRESLRGIFKNEEKLLRQRKESTAGQFRVRGSSLWGL